MKAGAPWPKPVKGFRHAGDLLPGPWSRQSVGKLTWKPAAREQGCHGHALAWWLGGEHGEGRKARQERTSSNRGDTRLRSGQSGVAAGQGQEKITFFLDLFPMDDVQVILIHRL